MSATSKPSKKATRIYDESERIARRYVNDGDFYDVARIEANELLCQRTINDLKKVWSNRCKMLETRARLVARGYEDAYFARDIEVLRRMWLGIQHRQREDVDYFKELRSA